MNSISSKKRLDTKVKPLETKLVATKKARADTEVARDEVVASRNKLEGELAWTESKKKYVQDELTSHRAKNTELDTEVSNFGKIA